MIEIVVYGKAFLNMNKKLSVKEYLINGIRDIVFGLEDGLVSTVGVLTGIASGTNDHFVVILSGFVLVIVEALSMGVGSFLSAQSERDMQQRQYKDLKKLASHDPQAAEDILVKHYQDIGLSQTQIESCLKVVEKNKQVFAKELGIYHLGMGATTDDSNTWINGILMFFSYIAGGAVPILPYFFLPVAQALVISIPLTVLALFVLGAAKGKLTYKNWVSSGLQMAVLSCSAALLGFLVGKLVAYWWGVNI